MVICNKREELEGQLEAFRKTKKRIGFVPTMGALHEGHLSLVQMGLVENDVMVVSIFVNPTQFDNPNDLKKYPRNLERDLGLLSDLDKNIIVYAPSDVDVYGNQIRSESFDFDGLEHQMEGKFRPGHFDGVGTIVKRLFEIVKPDAAYFGKKDFQQLRIIEKLVEKCQLPVTIIGCEIFRSEDGLAMSSRNERLTEDYRKAAPFIYKTLQEAKKRFGTEDAKTITNWVTQQFENNTLLELEYFTIADENSLEPIQNKINGRSYRAFIAIFAGDIRLIDNIALN